MLTFVNDKGTRRIVKISVSGTGKEALTKVADRYGMKEYIVGGRVYEWFMAQDDIFQRAVLGLLKGLEVDAARKFMERLAESAGIPDAIIEGELGQNAPPPNPLDRAPVKKRKPRRERDGHP